MSPHSIDIMGVLCCRFILFHTLRHELAHGRFVAQHEVVDFEIAIECFIADLHGGEELARLQMLIRSTNDSNAPASWLVMRSCWLAVIEPANSARPNFPATENC